MLRERFEELAAFLGGRLVKSETRYGIERAVIEFDEWRLYVVCVSECMFGRCGVGCQATVRDRGGKEVVKCRRRSCYARHEHLDLARRVAEALNMAGIPPEPTLLRIGLLWEPKLLD